MNNPDDRELELLDAALDALNAYEYWLWEVNKKEGAAIEVREWIDILDTWRNGIGARLAEAARARIEALRQQAQSS